MRLRTERRLVLALLACSLLPLAVLGGLAAAGFARLGHELTAAQSELLDARARQTALGAALRAADRASSLLQRSLADLRLLGHLPAEPSVYQEFCRTHLAPVRTGSGPGSPVIWPPLYLRAGYRAGAEGFEVGPFEPPSPIAIPDSPTPSDTGFWFEAEAASSETPRGLSRITVSWTPTQGAPGPVVWVDLDLLHLENLVATLPAPTCLVFFDKGGTPHRIGPPLPAAALLQPVFDPLTDADAGQLGVRWVDLDGTAAAAVPFRWSPVEVDEGVLGYAVAAVPPVSRAAEVRAMQALAGRYARAAVLLTFLTAGVITAVALLVARRALRPWTRLRERVSALVPEEPGGTDEVAAIADTMDRLAQEVQRSAGRLQETEARFREFLEMTPDGIAVLDTAGTVLHANSAFCQILRRPPGQVLGLSPREILAEPRAWPAVVARLRQRQRIRNYELPLRRADGKTVAALWSLRLALVEDREQVEAVVRDISEIKEAQEREREKTEDLFRVYGELQRAREVLERLESKPDARVPPGATDQVRTEFLLQMSHELRTPLNCIIGYSEAMIQGLDGPLTPDQAQSLERIAESGRRLLRLIENILDLSRLESGRVSIAPCPVDVKAVAEAVLHQARALVGGRPVRLSLEAPAGTPRAWADPDRLAQILFNLVGNAAKFTPHGEIRVSVREAGPGHLEVTVADTGPGIPAEERERIFEKFARGKNAGTEGAGLGLAICRELVERMGGTIWVESEPGRGSVFGFTLPTTREAFDLDRDASV
ncbi:sensor histidine kinase [Deferrisoma sp.]